MFNGRLFFGDIHGIFPISHRKPKYQWMRLMSVAQGAPKTSVFKGVFCRLFLATLQALSIPSTQSPCLRTPQLFPFPCAMNFIPHVL